MSARAKSQVIPVEIVFHSITVLRGHRVMLSHDLAKLYGITTFNLNKAVQRNLERFPSDFMFQLTNQEVTSLKFQIGISKPEGRGGRRRALPYAFTEQGVAMLSSVLNSPRAIAVNIAIMRAFMRMREMLSSNKALAAKLEELERKVETHDDAIVGIFKSMRDLMNPPKTNAIGFTADIRSNQGKA